MRNSGLGRTFYRLWGAAALTNLGDGVGLFALPLIAVTLTRVPSEVAMLTAALTAAWPLFGLHAGLVVDHLDRQRLLAAVNAVRALVLAGLALALAVDAVSIWTLYLVALTLGAGETLADTALTSLVPATVDRDQYGRANARLETTINLAHQFLGPPLAGVLAAIALTVATGTAAVAYALGAAAMLAGAHRRRRPSAPGAARVRDELIAGFAFLWAHPLLRRLTVATATMNVTWAFWTALFVVFAVVPGPLGLTPAEYGLLVSALAVGGVAGAVVVEPLRRRMGTRPLLAVDVIGSAFLLGAPALSTNLLVVGLAILVAGAGSAVWRVFTASIRQTASPDRLLGRVYSASAHQLGGAPTRRRDRRRDGRRGRAPHGLRDRRGRQRRTPGRPARHLPGTAAADRRRASGGPTASGDRPADVSASR